MKQTSREMYKGYLEWTRREHLANGKCGDYLANSRTLCNKDAKFSVVRFGKGTALCTRHKNRMVKFGDGEVIGTL